jgi:hypothetical protein
MFFKIKAEKMDINKKTVSQERLEGRASRLVDILAERPKHPKYKALKAELSAIMSEMQVREEDAVAFIAKLDK